MAVFRSGLKSLSGGNSLENQGNIDLEVNNHHFIDLGQTWAALEGDLIKHPTQYEYLWNAD